MGKSIAITGKLNETYNSQLNQIIDDSPGTTKSEIISKAVVAYLDGDNISDNNKQLIDELEKYKQALADAETQGQNLTTKTETLANEYQLEVDALQERVIALTHENVELKNSQTSHLPENQVIVTIPVGLKPFMDEILIAETRRVGKKITANEMLLQLFWHQIRYGAGDHLPVSYSHSQLKTVLEQIDNNQ